jgi:hypothetical protein
MIVISGIFVNVPILNAFFYQFYLHQTPQSSMIHKSFFPSLQPKTTKIIIEKVVEIIIIIEAVFRHFFFSIFIAIKIDTA